MASASRAWLPNRPTQPLDDGAEIKPARVDVPAVGEGQVCEIRFAFKRHAPRSRSKNRTSLVETNQPPCHPFHCERGERYSMSGRSSVFTALRG